MEQGTLCHGDTVMRIASISKPITACIAAKLVQDKKLDLDKNIQVGDSLVGNGFKFRTISKIFRQRALRVKTFRSQPGNCSVTQVVFDIIKRQALNMWTNSFFKLKNNPESKSSVDNEGKRADESSNKDVKKTDVAGVPPDTVYEEFYSRKKYKNVAEALEMFKNDPLEAKPGSKYLYTTHGFTLISGVLEKAGEKEFPLLLRDLFRQLGMSHTYLDYNSPIMSHRTK